jgi:hypothetical protein
MERKLLIYSYQAGENFWLVIRREGRLRLLCWDMGSSEFDQTVVEVDGLLRWLTKHVGITSYGGFRVCGKIILPNEIYKCISMEDVKLHATDRREGLSWVFANNANLQQFPREERLAILFMERMWEDWKISSDPSSRVMEVELPGSLVLEG